MVLDALSSPHRRSQSSFSPASSSSRRHRDELGSWSALFERHRYLLTMLAVLAFLCSVYLYFAVTLGAAESCSGASGAEKALCLGRLMKDKGKLKFM